MKDDNTPYAVAPYAYPPAMDYPMEYPNAMNYPQAMDYPTNMSYPQAMDYPQAMNYPKDMNYPAAMPKDMQQYKDIYPEVYHDLYPLVTDAASQMMAAGVTPTPEMMHSVVDNILKNSGMWYEDDDDDPWKGEAIPAQGGYGRMPYRSRRRRHHNRNTLRDIARILLLSELAHRNGGHYPYPMPY